MNNTVKIAGIDIAFNKAVRKANKGESVIIPANENGKPILACWNIPKCSEARKQLREVARKSDKGVVRFYSIEKGHICTLVVV